MWHLGSPEFYYETNPPHTSEDDFMTMETRRTEQIRSQRCLIKKWKSYPKSVAHKQLAKGKEMKSVTIPPPPM